MGRAKQIGALTTGSLGADGLLLDVQARMDALIQLLPDLIIELSSGGEILAAHSDRLPWLSDLVRSGLGRHMRSTLPEGLVAALTDMLANGRQTDAPQQREVVISALAGPQGYRVSLVRIANKVPGTDDHFMVAIHDASSSDQPNEMASFRDRQFSAFFAMCPHPILLNDFDTGQILDGNRAFTAVFDLDPQSSYLNPNVRQIMPGDGSKVMQAAADALKTAHTYGPVDVAFRRKDGSNFTAVLRCFLSVDPQGRRLVWSLIEDVTEIRAKEAALLAESQTLAATRARFLAAIEALDDGFAVFDAEDRLVLWNTPYTRIFDRIADLITEGALYDDLLRAAIERGVFGAEGERDEENLRGRLQRALTEVWDNEDKFADGRLIWVRERSTPMRETVGVYEDVTARRLADRRLQQVVDGGGIAVWDWESDHGFSTINDCWETMLGLGSSRALDALVELVHPEDRMAVFEAQRELFLQGREEFGLRCRMRHQSGKWVWLLTRGHVASRWADGSPRRISGITLDVTVQSEAEQRLSQVIDGAQVGTWEHDMRTGVTLVSDRWAEILGYHAVELSPMPLDRWLDMLHPADAAALIEHEREAFEAGQWQVAHEVRLRHRDGHWVWVLTRAQVIEWDESGRPVKTSGINLDITAAKALESSLARERDTLARIMETSVSGIVAVDGSGAVVFANAAAERVFGRPILEGDNLLELLGTAAPTDLSGEDIGVQDLPLAQALSGPAEVLEHRLRIYWPDGEVRVIAATSARLSAPGTDLAVVCTFTDITDEVQAETRLRAAMTAAEAASRAKSDFLAAMSHEIRTPLNGVLGMANVLAEKLSDPADRAMLRVIRDSGEHLLGVINDILDLAKIEAGRLTLDPRPIRLPDILDRVAALHRTTADEKNIRLTTECHGGGPDERRLGDEMRLIQILHNLLGNALKFTDAGTVSVEIDCRDRGRVVIRVRDSGIGMTRAEIARAFDEFTQGLGGSRRSHVGTGLGLPIVRRLARLMNGEVRLTSVAGQGVTAEADLELPVLAGAATRLRETAIPSLPPMRVLAAEDNATNRIILKSMLTALGVDAVIVSGGAEALDRFAGDRFDALLLDIAMPGMDGPTTLAGVTGLADRLGRAAPRAVAVTANVMTHQVANYLQQGFTAVVAKPIRMDLLAQALLQCVT